MHGVKCKLQVRGVKYKLQVQVASAWIQLQLASAWSQVQVASARSQVQVASARSQLQLASAWSQVQVASAWSQVQVASARSQVQVASARSQVQLTCEELKCLLRAAELFRRHSTKIDPLRGLAWSRCKSSWFFAILFWLARPSAGIGVVEVQELEVLCDFVLARATLCGDRRGRGAKTRGFLRFCLGPCDPLRGSAWSRCKNSRFFAILFWLARPSAGIGVVEVQKLVVFALFLARATLYADRRGRSAKTQGVFAPFVVRAVVSWFARLLPAGRGFESPLVQGAGFASCTEQLAQRNLRRATCALTKPSQSGARMAVVRTLHESDNVNSQFLASVFWLILSI